MNLSKVKALISILSVLGGMIASYYKAMGDVNSKIDEIQRQNIETFAKTEDLKMIAQELKEINGRLASLEGYIRGMDKRDRDRDE